MTGFATRVTALSEEHFGMIGISGDKSYTDQGADSLDIIEWVMLLEEEFETEITDEQARRCITIKGSIDLITELVTP